MNYKNKVYFNTICNENSAIADQIPTKSASSAPISIFEEEIISAEITMPSSTTHIDAKLQKLNAELDRYTNNADKGDYAFAVASGIISGAIDALVVGEMSFSDDDIALSHEQMNKFIQRYAKAKGHDEERLKKSIQALEDNFKVAQDNVWKGKKIGVSAKNHHLADYAHHPTPLGLVSAIAVQFLRVGTFVNKDGEWHFLLVDTSAKDIIQILAPAAITGILNWLAAAAEKSYEAESGEEIPKAIKKLIHLIASTPMIIEIIKCADNWFSHLVSDMGGSKNTAGAGMGIPGIFVSMLHEMSALPILKNSGLPAFVNDLYTNKRIDLRKEMLVYKGLARQTIPVIFNELFVRTGYFVSRLIAEINDNGIKNIHWNNVIPFGSRTVDRMITVSSITLNIADTADAAVHAAIESGANWVLFAGRFAVRYNYIAAGRAALSIVKEISAEKTEAQLIHEKMLLTEAKTEMLLGQLQEYKTKLSEKVSEYIAEDIEAFMSGFDAINEGIVSSSSDLIIKGNVTIQRVLEREPQFGTQEEFDELMDSDDEFVF